MCPPTATSSPRPAARDQQPATSSPARERRRHRLDRSRVAAAALDEIDEHGLEALSMRALGARLGVEAMTLYRYTPSKADLLDAVVERLLTQMRTASATRPANQGQDWKVHLHDIAHAVHGTARAHPSAFGLLARYTPPHAWLRPPLCDPTWAASILCDLQAAGFDETTALGAYHDLAGFLLGHLLPQAARDAATTTRGTSSGAMRTGIGTRKGPMAHRLQRLAPRASTTEQFDETLDRLIGHLPLSSHRG